MELRHIRYFLAVAEERHFTRAARKVGIGQPPLSQQIRDLEDEIGAPLFRRVAHGAELTAAGSAFLDAVGALPALAERAVSSARRAARGETGSLKVGFTASTAFNAVVPSAIRAFRHDYPEVELSLEEANTTRLVAGLSEGTLDVAFLRPGAAGIDNFHLRPLAEEPLVVVLSERHAKSTAGAIDLAGLAEDPFLLFPRPIGPTLYDSIVGACRDAGFDPRIAQLAPQIASIVNLVAADLGVSIVPASMSQLRVTGVVYRPISGRSPVARIALGCRRADPSPLVRNFVALAAPVAP